MRICSLVNHRPTVQVQVMRYTSRWSFAVVPYLLCMECTVRPSEIFTLPETSNRILRFIIWLTTFFIKTLWKNRVHIPGKCISGWTLLVPDFHADLPWRRSWLVWVQYHHHGQHLATQLGTRDTIGKAFGTKGGHCLLYASPIALIMRIDECDCSLGRRISIQYTIIYPIFDIHHVNDIVKYREHLGRFPPMPKDYTLVK